MIKVKSIENWKIIMNNGNDQDKKKIIIIITAVIIKIIIITLTRFPTCFLKHGILVYGSS